MIVRDDRLALNYLLSLPEVDPERGGDGMSMGSTALVAGALDDRISCVLCRLSDPLSEPDSAWAVESAQHLLLCTWQIKGGN